MPHTLVQPDRSDARTSTGDHLEVPVAQIMTPGVLTIVEDASLRHALRAMYAHRVHAILVVGRTTGRPVGWITERSLLAWVGRDDSMALARSAVTEPPEVIAPHATAREALSALSRPGVTHLLVATGPTAAPEGVVSAFDLVALAAR